MSLLEVEGLNSYYEDSHILFDVSLTVERNEVVALLGRNGAGKSTTLKSLMGVVTPRAGSTAPKSPAKRATPSPAPACSSCTRTAASSAASMSRTTSFSPD
jgi:ABC-type branched-subunit amino acid transport system ATPase component